MTQEEAPGYDMSIHHNPDAQAWARFYCETFPDADEALMTGWFANAMMAMYDWKDAQLRALGIPDPATYVAAMNACVEALHVILERGYVSGCIEEERPDYEQANTALTAARTAQGNT